jgi:hypothetical protein
MIEKPNTDNLESASEDWDKSFETLCFLMGQAMLTWQKVEDATFRLFTTLVQTSRREVASVLFYSIESFDARRNIISRIIQVSKLPSAKNAEWNNICAELKSANTQRNAIAHYSDDIEAIATRELEDGGVVVSFGPFSLKSPTHNVKNVLQGFGPKGLPEKLDAKDLSKLVGRFFALATRVEEFNQLLIGTLTKQEVGRASSKAPPWPEDPPKVKP